MVRKSFRLTLTLDLHKVTCPGVWLCPKGRVFITVSLFRCTEATRQVKPHFPLKFKQRFVFDKVFDDVESLTDFESRLSQKEFRLEMVQIFKSTLRIVSLAVFQAPLSNVVYPIGTQTGEAEMDMLFERCKTFPGIIAPKAEVKLRVCIEELDGTGFPDGTSPTLMSSAPAKELSTGVVHSERCKLPLRVCHTKFHSCPFSKIGSKLFNEPFGNTHPRKRVPCKKRNSCRVPSQRGLSATCRLERSPRDEVNTSVLTNGTQTLQTMTQPHFDGIERPSPSPDIPSKCGSNIADIIAHYEAASRKKSSQREQDTAASTRAEDQCRTTTDMPRTRNEWQAETPERYHPSSRHEKRSSCKTSNAEYPELEESKEPAKDMYPTMSRAEDQYRTSPHMSRTRGDWRAEIPERICNTNRQDKTSTGKNTNMGCQESVESKRDERCRGSWNLIGSRCTPPKSKPESSSRHYSNTGQCAQAPDSNWQNNPSGYSRFGRTDETPRVPRDSKLKTRFLNMDSLTSSPIEEEPLNRCEPRTNRRLSQELARTSQTSRQYSKAQQKYKNDDLCCLEVTDEDGEAMGQDSSKLKTTKSNFHRRDTPHPCKTFHDSPRRQTNVGSASVGSREGSLLRRDGPGRCPIDRNSPTRNSIPKPPRKITDQESAESHVSPDSGRRNSLSSKHTVETNNSHQYYSVCKTTCETVCHSGKRRIESEIPKISSGTSPQSSAPQQQYDPRNWNEVEDAQNESSPTRTSPGSSSQETIVNDVTGSSGSSLMDLSKKCQAERRTVCCSPEVKKTPTQNKPWKVYGVDAGYEKTEKQATVRVSDIPESEKWRTRCKCPCQEDSSTPIKNSSGDDCGRRETFPSCKTTRQMRTPGTRGKVSQKRRRSASCKKSTTPNVGCDQMNYPADNRLVHCCLCCVCDQARNATY